MLWDDAVKATPLPKWCEACHTARRESLISQVKRAAQEQGLDADVKFIDTLEVKYGVPVYEILLDAPGYIDPVQQEQQQEEEEKKNA